jgi:hypothetical protein
VPRTAIAAAAWSCVEKMLHDAQRTCGAERLQRLDQHRGLDGHVQRAGDARAAQRLLGANSSRIAIRPGISVSAMRISLRPQSASARSATLKSPAAPGFTTAVHWNLSVTMLVRAPLTSNGGPSEPRRHSTLQRSSMRVRTRKTTSRYRPASAASAAALSVFSQVNSGPCARSGRRPRSSGRSDAAGRASARCPSDAGRSAPGDERRQLLVRHLPVPKVVTMMLVGSATPIAYETCTSQRSTRGRRPRRSSRRSAPRRRPSGRPSGILAGERAAAVGRRATVGVDDDLAAREAAVAVRTADDELAGRVDEVADAVLHQFRRQHRLHDLLDDGFARASLC